MLRNMADVRRYLYFELGLPVLTVAYVLLEVKVKARPSCSVAVILAGIHHSMKMEIYAELKFA